MALRRCSHLNPLRLGSRALSTSAASNVLDHVVSITVVDREGVRRIVKGVEGEQLHDVLATDDAFREAQMVIAPNGRGAWDTHVFVSKEISKRLPAPSEQELYDLKKAAEDPGLNSRMASSITLTKDIDGAVIALGDVLPWVTL